MLVNGADGVIKYRKEQVEKCKKQLDYYLENGKLIK